MKGFVNTKGQKSFLCDSRYRAAAEYAAGQKANFDIGFVGAGMPVGTAEKPFPLADERYNNRCIDNVAKIAAFLHISKRKKIN